MIVEDDPKIARLLGEGLARFGYDVFTVDDPAGAKEAFVQNKPDLLLLDINLPRYDGFYLCRQIRAVSKVPIIFISARLTSSIKSGPSKTAATITSQSRSPSSSPWRRCKAPSAGPTGSTQSFARLT